MVLLQYMIGQTFWMIWSLMYPILNQLETASLATTVLVALILQSSLLLHQVIGQQLALHKKKTAPQVLISPKSPPLHASLALNLTTAQPPQCPIPCLALRATTAPKEQFQ